MGCDVGFEEFVAACSPSSIVNAFDFVDFVVGLMLFLQKLQVLTLQYVVLRLVW